MIGDTNQCDGTGNYLLTAVAQAIKVRIHKWDYMKYITIQQSEQFLETGDGVHSTRG